MIRRRLVTKQEASLGCSATTLFGFRTPPQMLHARPTVVCSNDTGVSEQNSSTLPVIGLFVDPKKLYTYHREYFGLNKFVHATNKLLGWRNPRVPTISGAHNIWRADTIRNTSHLNFYPSSFCSLQNSTMRSAGGMVATVASFPASWTCQQIVIQMAASTTAAKVSQTSVHWDVFKRLVVSGGVSRQYGLSQSMSKKFMCQSCFACWLLCFATRVCSCCRIVSC